MEGKKIVASFELTLMLLAMFAFSYGIAATDGVFEELDKQYEERDRQIAERMATLDIKPAKSIFRKLSDAIVEGLKEPILPLASAREINLTLETGYILTEEVTVESFSISSNAANVGCCFLAKNGEKCATSAPLSCVETSPFAEGSLCASTSFCKKGCCYDESLGIYDRSVLEGDCPTSWVADPNCNMLEARLGCCILGTETIFETRGQCEVDTTQLALGPNSVTDWRPEVNEGQCAAMSSIQTEGACVLAGGNCKFITESDCFSYNGEFNEGYLCTAKVLNTSCEKTDQTTCVDGKDEVYFLDSCGNYANIYDSSKLNDYNYWERVAEPEDVCGDFSKTGNANSESCGNCNRFIGGICASASEDNFNVDNGNFYCRSTSCEFKGEIYGNGESWCEYDGKIDDGDDVVGSRHWKYVCSQGVVQIEPCADYRNQICVQTNTFDVQGNEVEFRNAACIANNWRKCLDMNGDKDVMEECADTLNCRVEEVKIADKFSFDVCMPRYPGGFNLRDERYEMTAKQLCGIASQTCTVVYKPKTWGGCEIVANKGCLGAGFVEEMNDMCRGIGDCGGSVNILGEYNDNYKLRNSPDLSTKYISDLIKMSAPVPGQIAEVEDYTEFLEAAGLIGDLETPVGELGEDTLMNNIGMGAVGIGYAAGFISLVSTIGSLSGALALEGISAVATISQSTSVLGAAGSLAPFAGFAIGLGIGMIAGAMIAKSLGLSPGGSLLMSIGGGLIGGIAGYALLTNSAPLLGIPVLGLALFIIGVVLVIVSLFFGGDDCDPIEVQFECKPWQAPSGADDCEKCNGDPLKPCSEYRCASLGAACEIINKGTEDEMCVDGSPDDVNPPVLGPSISMISEDEEYTSISESGFSITSGGGCIDAYTQLVFGITTDEPAQCKFDIAMNEFENMEFDLGGNSYIRNHTTSFLLPDPSHGQSQGADWNGDMTLYVKCRDVKGHESPGFYTVDLCVVEGDDVTAPMIRGSEPKNDLIIGFEKTSQDVSIVTNELSTCKWSSTDVDYGAMANSMICNDTLARPSNPLGYTCSDILPVSNGTNTYYVKCMDQPWVVDETERNANVESFVYELRKPERKIAIDSIEPSEDFEVNTTVTTIYVEVDTSGGAEYHWCSYSFSGYENMIQMFETGESNSHEQMLNRPAVTNHIYIECTDETGDFVRGETEFRIIHDTSTPQVARVWQNGGTMYIVTNEDADCRYSTSTCRFDWDSGEMLGVGETHSFSTTRGDTYYIKCEDEFGNIPRECSITARAL